MWRSNLLIITEFSRSRVAIILVAREIVLAERSTGISPAILAPIGDEADVFRERFEAGQLAHVAENRVPKPVGPEHVY